jgi:erythromycin esterase
MHTLDDWIAKDAIRFKVDSPDSIDTAVDRVMASLGGSVELLALGEALHGSEEILLIRNRLFQRLVQAHGYSAVVIEVTSPQARAINDYVLGLRGGDDPSVKDWFGTGFGLLDANQELVEWMRQYNKDAAHPVKLHFYGFDLPLGKGGLASPSLVLDIVFDYLGNIDGASAKAHRDRVAPLVGENADWERLAAMFDPAQSIGLTQAAAELRIATEDLITELSIRRPELTAKSDAQSYADALHHAELARELLNAHAALATPGAYAVMLGIRDLIMADNLEHFVAQERGRGKVLVFAASGHLKRSTVQWTLPPGDEVKEWWPAGSHITERFGSRYAVIGQALGVSGENAIGVPEEGSLEARLTKEGGAMFIPTHDGVGFPVAEIAGLPIRSGSALNPTYEMLTPLSFTDFEWLVVFDTTAYPRGAPPLTAWSG